MHHTARIIIIVLAFILIPMMARAERQPYEWPPKGPNQFDQLLLRDFLLNEYMKRHANIGNKEQEAKDKAAKEEIDPDKLKEALSKIKEEEPSQPVEEEFVNPFESNESESPYAKPVWSMDEVKRLCANRARTRGAYNNCLSRNERRVGRSISPYDANLIDQQ